LFKTRADLFEHVKEQHGYYDGARDVFVPPRSKELTKSLHRDQRKQSREENELLTKKFPRIGENFEMALNKDFRFKHPFCMMVAGPSRSGKTHWVMNLLRERRIEPVPHRIIYCYAHWQEKYDELKQFAPNTHFNQGLPYAYFLKQLENCVIVLDDLMDVAMKEPTIMSIFTEGSHHRNVSVIFLSQNIFHLGKHSRTMSLNVQYMVLFKNARDQSQIQTLARQMFPTDWRSFLQHYEVETSKDHGHVILDLHPSTPNDRRIVTDATSHVTPSQTLPTLGDQFYRMSNPYAQPLLDAEQNMSSILTDKSLPIEERVDGHVNALKKFTLMRDNFQQHEQRKHYTNPAISPSSSNVSPPGIQLVGQLPKSQEKPSMDTESDDEPDTTDSLHYGEVLPDGSDPKMLSHEDTAEERKRKMDYIQEHIFEDPKHKKYYLRN
jgi:hypothetical protein